MNHDLEMWYHGKLSREESEVIVKEFTDDGTFLIRESSTAVGDFVLTLLFQDQVCHYQIRRHGDDAIFSIDDKVKICHGLDTLVEFYQKDANGLVTKLTKCIKGDAPPNDMCSHGTTRLLHRATKENNLKVVSEILKSKYKNVDAKNQDGQTAAHLAALYCDEPIMKMLLEEGVNVNCMDTSGFMPLHYACRSKPGAFIKLLIDGHANVQGRNMQNGHVPLHEAARYGNLDAVKELLAAWAPHLPRTSSGELPIDLAKDAGQKEMVQFLSTYEPPEPSACKSQWYHGTLKREEAVAALEEYAANMKEEAQKLSSKPGTPTSPSTVEVDANTGKEKEGSQRVDTSGCFLVRLSDRKSTNAGYVLTLLCNDQIKNYLISRWNNFLYIDDGPYLSSLEHLVEHFMRFSDGLPINLKHPVSPKPKPPLPLFSTMPRTPRQKSVDLTCNAVPSESEKKSLKVPEYPQKYAIDSPNIVEKQTVTKKKSKDNSKETGSMFNSLIRSPKKTLLIDGMNSLRKTKSNQKKQRSLSDGRDEIAISPEEQLNKANDLFKNMKFSADKPLPLPLRSADTGKETQPIEDGVYNVPKNNAVVERVSFEVQDKTEAEADYFTRSDMDIEQERMSGTVDPFEGFPANEGLTSNGYIQTVDVRVFQDSQGDLWSTGFSPEDVEASAAELRHLSANPERLDSLISNMSTESGIMRFFDRQNRTASQTTDGQSMPTPPSTPRLKLNCFIPYECLELGAVIGKGEFGYVHKGHLVRQHSETGEEIRCPVAIKTLRDESIHNKRELLREASVMIRLQHHCIVKLIGISIGEKLMMVQELVPLGSMLTFIWEFKNKLNPNYELKLWASQIACGMQYLESRHYVHRDLAARNILLASRNQVKISDFGLSRALCSGNDCYTASQDGKWPVKWYAPESLMNGRFSHASDVWSFGVTLWEMYSLGETPYGERPGIEVIKLIQDGQRLTQPPLCPDHVYEVMHNCWNFKPRDRPTFRYLTEFFAKDPEYQNLIELIKTEHIS